MSGLSFVIILGLGLRHLPIDDPLSDRSKGFTEALFLATRSTHTYFEEDSSIR